MRNTGGRRCGPACRDPPRGTARHRGGDVRLPLTRERIASARSFLFVPGHRPDRFAKALHSGADVVIIDLEDAVAGEDKDRARGHVGEWLEHGNKAAVRINPPGDSLVRGRSRDRGPPWGSDHGAQGRRHWA
ncbi:aldolase/citrate lyase family protein [Saccharopolyspora hattusasensis]|uniref:aldolase/citrate lyase family protein n=1 Tax=Saccharopolyspora hattusasensis TaxID=1128679 RepID=UPI003D95E7E2